MSIKLIYMKTTKALLIVLVLSMGLFSCNTSQTEEKTHSTAVPKMAMTTEIPEGISTPNTLNSSTIGELNFFDGVPVPETEDKVYDYIDLHNAVMPM